jgi:hypothetical protein
MTAIVTTRVVGSAIGPPYPDPTRFAVSTNSGSILDCHRWRSESTAPTVVGFDGADGADGADEPTEPTVPTVPMEPMEPTGPTQRSASSASAEPTGRQTVTFSAVPYFELAVGL